MINLVNEFFLNFLFQLCGVCCYLFLPIRLYTIMHGFVLLLGFIWSTIDLLLYIFDASRQTFPYMYSFILSSDCNAWGVPFSSHKIGKCNKKNALWYLNFVLRLVNYSCFVIFLMLCWLICKLHFNVYSIIGRTLIWVLAMFSGSCLLLLFS